MGQEVTAKSVLIENVTPLYVRDVYEAVKDSGWGSLLTVGVPGFLGVGIQTYRPTGSTAATELIEGEGRGLLKGEASSTQGGLLKNAEGTKSGGLLRGLTPR